MIYEFEKKADIPADPATGEPARIRVAYKETQAIHPDGGFALKFPVITKEFNAQQLMDFMAAHVGSDQPVIDAMYAAAEVLVGKITVIEDPALIR